MSNRAGLTVITLPCLVGLLLAQNTEGKGRDLLVPVPVDLSQPALPSGFSIPSLAAVETTYFGGTLWDPVDMRWEALRDSVWTFESGVASAINTDPSKKMVGLHSLMEGWVGVNNRVREHGSFRRLNESDFAGSVPCVGDATTILGGDWSLWAGFLQAEAESACFAEGQGYGHNWDIGVGQTFNYTGGTVQMRFSYILETEVDFDYAQVLVETGGVGSGRWITAWSLSGTTSGDTTLTLEPGNHLPGGPGDVTLMFTFRSDGVYDDEDGENSTKCGAFAVDDIVLSGGIVHSADFESATGGWERMVAYPLFSAEWSDIQAVSDLPVVAGSDTCSLGDSVLTFVEGRPPRNGHSCPYSNLAVSPWIDLKEAGLAGLRGYVVEYDGFFNLPLANYFFVTVEAQWFPEICPHSGNNILSEFASTGFVYAFQEPTCSTRDGPQRADFTYIIPPHAERVRIAVGVLNYGSFLLCDVVTQQNTTPWFDNIRFGVFEPPPDNIWYVPGEVSTIQAAIDTAVSGDTVMVAPGEYEECLRLENKSLVITSESGFNRTILSGVGLPPGESLLSIQGADSTTLIQGFRFEDAGDSTAIGGAISCTNGTNAVITGNTFRRNVARLGGAIYVGSSSPQITHNRFEENMALEGGGGIGVAGWSEPVIANNWFLQNQAIGFNQGTGMGGAIYLQTSLLASATVSGNTFWENMAESAGAIRVLHGTPNISGNTIVHNVATMLNTASGIGIDSSTASVENNIVAFNEGGWGMEVNGGAVSLQCNDFWQNELGDYTGISPGPSDFSIDPLFCNALSGNFGLASNSPCLPENSGGCGRVGSRGIGCAPVSVLLSYFTAEWIAQTVVLRWEVTEAADHAGFHVHRQTPGSERGRLTDQLLAGQSEYEFIDETAPKEGAEYWLAEISRTGETTWHGPAVLSLASLPARVALSPPVPNPFTSETRITYSLPSPQHVSLAVYDLQGRRITTLVDKHQIAGEYTVSWDGNQAASGLYFLRLQAGAVRKTQKLMVLR